MRDNTIARHGLRFRMNGFPIYDDGEIVGEIVEPWWDEDDLTADQAAEVDAFVAEWVAARPGDDPVWARWAILERDGVRHTHRQGKPIIPDRPARGYVCAMCQGWVVNENPGDFLFVGGPVDGRWIVTDGGPVWRVPIVADLSPATWLPEGSVMDTPTMQVATYVRRRNRYVLEA